VLTIPTGPVSFSQIQSEFGGTSPISLSEYYRGGVNVPSNQATSSTDGTAVSTSGAIRVGMFRGLTKVVAGVVSSLGGDGSLPDTYSVRIGTSSIAWVNWYSDGEVRGYRHGNVLVWTENWYSPTTAGVGSSYWIRATVQSGQAPNGGSDSPINTWVALSTGPTWSYLSSSGVAGSRSGTLLFQISSNSSGTNIVSSGTAYFYAEHDQ
jgi:hypothetical protein